MSKDKMLKDKMSKDKMSKDKISQKLVILSTLFDPNLTAPHTGWVPTAGVRR
jgi:hypothetical protein